MFTLLNVQGLIGRRYNKLNSVELKQVFASSDIIMFTEAWSNDCYDYHVDGFNYYILHRTIKNRRAQRDSGGLIIYISDKLRSSADDLLLKTVDDSIIWLKLKGTVFGLQNDLFLGRISTLRYYVKKRK